MITICLSEASKRGEHSLEWTATMDGGGYWRCVNAGCGDVEHDGTGHQGG